MFGILVGLFTLVALVIVHEYGHFLAARRNGVEVKEFGIGFPPRLAGKKMGKGIYRAYYTLNLLPFGGFVKLKGENESATSKNSFGAAPFSVKIKIAIAGVMMNFIVGALLFTYLAATGMPSVVGNQYSLDSQVVAESNQKLIIAEVTESGPANEAGLLKGDIITKINNVEIRTGDDFTSQLDANLGQEVVVEYQRGRDVLTADTKLNSEDDELVIGAGVAELKDTRYSWWAAPVVGIGTTIQTSIATIEGIGGSLIKLVSGNFGQAAENVTGPIGIFSLLDSMSVLGASYVVFFAAFISVTLAVINILPLPALDGGRLLISIVVRVFGLKLTQMRENIIHLTGFAFMLLLAILITIVDIGRI